MFLFLFITFQETSSCNCTDKHKYKVTWKSYIGFSFYMIY